ncbi:MAG: tyrosine-type recombinase/integrase [Solirubrobacterales bacterium]
MPRPATGSIIERWAADGRTYRTLRFYALGRRRTLPLGPVSRAEAERQLAFVMADVARGQWRPPLQVEPTAEVEIPTFHVFAEQWWLLHERRWRPKTVEDYRWKLEAHLLPFFGEFRLDRITVAEVERYAAAKLAEKPRPLSPRSINASITLLAQILEAALDRDLMMRNPARGHGRKVRERPPARTYLETAGQIEALLAAAAELDQDARVDRRHVERQAILATMMFAGLRIGELCALRWRDVDLTSGWITIGDAKTPAGRRRVKIRGGLAIVLAEVRARQAQLDQDGYVFATPTGRPSSGDNVRNRILKAAVQRANENLARDDLPPLPSKLTPHSLRRTFCSLLYALGEDPGVVMDEMGHADPGLALRIYRQAMRRGDDEQQQLRAVVAGRTFNQKATTRPTRPSGTATLA